LKDQLERDLDEELGEAGPATTLIDTSAAAKRKPDQVAGCDGALMFSRLKTDEKFLAHLAAIDSNLQVSDEELGKAKVEMT